MKDLIAQINIGPLRGLGPLGLETDPTGETASSRFSSFLSGAIGLITIIAAIWFTFNFLIGAIGVITASGDKAKVESARNRITTGIIGLVVVVAGIFIIQLLGSLIGLGDIILSPTDIINKIAPGTTTTP